MSARQAHACPDVYLFFALACGITWALDVPLAMAFANQAQPAPYAMSMAGLSAWGPTIAAVLVASRRGEVRGIFGPWRANPLLVLLALATPFLVHLPATLIEVALGGKPAQWFYPPVLPEHVAALVMFSVGEELGWRGYAYPRIARFHGPVVGSLILGSVWGVWHLVMMFTPDGGTPTLFGLGKAAAELALWSVVVAWLFERGHRSLWVAIAVHAGAHLDNVNRAPLGEVRLQVLRFAVLCVAAALAARALSANPPLQRTALRAPAERQYR